MPKADACFTILAYVFLRIFFPIYPNAFLAYAWFIFFFLIFYVWLQTIPQKRNRNVISLEIIYICLHCITREYGNLVSRPIDGLKVNIYGTRNIPDHDEIGKLPYSPQFTQWNKFISSRISVTIIMSQSLRDVLNDLIFYIKESLLHWER